MPVAETVEEIIRKLKVPTLEAAMDLSIPIDMQGQRIGKLVPVGSWIFSAEQLIEDFAHWRSEAMEMFFARFEASVESTREYLRVMPLGSGNRILFVIEENQEFIGHIGISNLSRISGEIDNVLRGKSPDNKGLMLSSQRTLCHWAFDQLGLERLTLKVASYNYRAKRLYEQVGFRLISSSPLKVVSEGGIVNFVPCDMQDATVDFTSDVMELTADRL
jgi:RimJ/RimL family protein N-acetyltransferase